MHRESLSARVTRFTTLPLAQTCQLNRFVYCISLHNDIVHRRGDKVTIVHYAQLSFITHQITRDRTHKRYLPGWSKEEATKFHNLITTSILTDFQNSFKTKLNHHLRKNAYISGKLIVSNHYSFCAFLCVYLCFIVFNCSVYVVIISRGRC